MDALTNSVIFSGPEESARHLAHDTHANATLYRAESVPFDTPSAVNIALKVINNYGDEVMKVLEVG